MADSYHRPAGRSRGSGRSPRLRLPPASAL